MSHIVRVPQDTHPSRAQQVKIGIGLHRSTDLPIQTGYSSGRAIFYDRSSFHMLVDGRLILMS